MLKKKALLVLAVAAVSAVARAQEVPVAQAPVARAGDTISWVTTLNQDKGTPSTWTVESISPDGEVLAANKSRSRVRVHPRGEVLVFKVYSYDAAASDHKGPLLRDFSTDKSTIDFSIQVGKSWKVARLPFMDEGANSVFVDGFDAQVVAYEKIEVQGGIFDGFKIEYRGWRNDRTLTAMVQTGVSGKSEADLWYAPKARAAVLIQYKIYEWKTQRLQFEYRREVTSVKLSDAQ